MAAGALGENYMGNGVNICAEEMVAIVTTEMVDTENAEDLAQGKFFAGEPNFVGIAFGTGKYHGFGRTLNHTSVTRVRGGIAVLFRTG